METQMVEIQEIMGNYVSKSTTYYSLIHVWCLVQVEVKNMSDLTMEETDSEQQSNTSAPIESQFL